MWDVAFQNLAISIVRWNHRGPVVHEVHGRWIPVSVMILSSELQHLNNPLRHFDQWNLNDSKDMQHLWQFYSLLRVPKERDLLFGEQRCRQLPRRTTTSTLRTHSAPSGPTLTTTSKPTTLSEHSTSGISKVFWTTCTVGTRLHRTKAIYTSMCKKNSDSTTTFCSIEIAGTMTRLRYLHCI